MEEVSEGQHVGELNSCTQHSEYVHSDLQRASGIGKVRWHAAWHLLQCFLENSRRTALSGSSVEHELRPVQIICGHGHCSCHRAHSRSPLWISCGLLWFGTVQHSNVKVKLKAFVLPKFCWECKFDRQSGLVNPRTTKEYRCSTPGALHFGSQRKL